ncbi:DUF1090 domain-containing protein [Erwinia aphidicola]|uniref:DUF1090 domain-containing protein n=1 Tax=Erwinia aphidicola TaxID=68334 RepID=UPI00174689D4|nr:DUF1090 domain-containing protein [Erwinia aphidicola]MBD1376322.1 DUF1090 domain-containing protein [Erwinia aphidicola]
MKIRLLMASLLMVMGSAHAAETLTGCAAKRVEVAQQIQYADAHGNSAQKAGLERALKEIDQHCTDSSLMADRQQKVQEKMEKVAERQADLREAQAGGSSKKIAKQQEKLARAQQELQEARDSLSQ